MSPHEITLANVLPCLPSHHVNSIIGETMRFAATYNGELEQLD